MRHLAGLWSKITDRINYDGQHSDWKGYEKNALVFTEALKANDTKTPGEMLCRSLSLREREK